MANNQLDVTQIQDRVPLPPTGADVLGTGCDYCVVGCSYKVIRWPVGMEEGGPNASENAMGLDFPRPPGAGGWVSPNMHNIVSHNGVPHHVLVVPDWEAKAINPGGAHSFRGGSIAQKCYNPNSATRDRLQTPLLRVNGELVPISWEAATDIAAEVGNYALEKYGDLSWAMKMYSYQFTQNTYALSKLAFRSVQTAAFAFHEHPANGPDTPGFTDAGYDNFAPAYEDWGNAEVLFMAGTDPFETKTVIFESWILPAVQAGRQKLIYVNPRRTTGVAFAEANGGLFLQIVPGTDTVLLMAMARVILENGWEDSDWIEKYSASKWDYDSGFGQGTRNTPMQWRTTWDNFRPAGGFPGYKEFILSQEESELKVAERITGISRDLIVQAAEMMCKPRADGSRPKTSMGMEKGLYWSNNYLNTAAFASLGMLCGTGNRPGQMLGRFGGHQLGGGASGGKYPLAKSPEKFIGRRRKALDLDRWVQMGNVRFVYVIGTTWIGSMAGSQELAAAFSKLTTENPHQVTGTDTAEAIATLKRRVDSGGMAVVNQEIYLREPIGTQFADLVLPAASWGEEDFVRAQGERRWKVYSKFMDPPGEAKPDWWITAQIATKMGFPGYDWKDSNEVFEEASRFMRTGRINIQPLVWAAKKEGVPAMELLRSLGNDGIQAPVMLEDGKLYGTKRLHDSTRIFPETGPEGTTIWPKNALAFGSHNGKAMFLKTPWSLFSDYWEWLRPKGDELWVTNGRVSEIWQSGFDDERRDIANKRWPEPAVEIHPDDAAARGIESGDYVEMVNDRLAVQVSGFMGIKSDDASFTGLMRDGHIRMTTGRAEAVAIVTDAIKPGVAFMHSLSSKAKQMANSLVPAIPDPISGMYRYKLGIGKIRKIGESPYKNDDLERMSLAPRDII